jgi:hypothetical protein
MSISSRTIVFSLALGACSPTASTPDSSTPTDSSSQPDRATGPDAIAPQDSAPSDSEVAGDATMSVDATTLMDVGVQQDSAQADSTAPMDATIAMDAAAGCNALTSAGAPSPELVRVAEAAPVLTGGPLVAGVYVRTGWSAYTGVGGATGGTGSRRRTRLVVSAVTASGATLQWADSLNGAADSTANASMSISGSMSTVTVTCPGSANLRRFYQTLTAPTRLQFFSSSNGELETYTLESELGDAGTPSADASTDGAVSCVTITNTAPVITTRNVVGGTLPAATGGAIPDGRYHLTDVYYTRAASTRQQQLTIVLSAGEAQIIDTRPGVSETRARATMVIVGNTLRGDTTCPSVSMGTPISFTSSGSTITLIHSADQRVEVLTRQ